MEASLFRTLDAIFTSTLVGRVLHSCVSKSPAVTSLLHLSHFTIMSFNSVWTKGGAGLSCCGCIGDCMKQQGHFTSLQLKSMNQWTKQYVQTSALHNSSRGWHSIFKQIGHCNCSMIAGCSCSKVSGDTVSTVLVGLSS